MTDPSPTICLTFDFDAMSNWIGSMGFVDPGNVTRGEFDAVAVPRLLKLLDRRGIQASFAIPGFTAHVYPDLVRAAADQGHEIVHHGWIHENPKAFDCEGERENLLRGIEALERVTGARPVGYRSPAWEFSTETVSLLQQEGFEYDSGLMAQDFEPYYVRHGDVVSTTEPYRYGEIVDLVEMPVSWTLDDWPYFEFAFGINTGLAAPSQVLEIWKGEFDFMRRDCPDGVFVLTMHPQVIGRGHRLLMLEQFLDYVSDAGAQFSRMDTFARAWRSANPLDAWKASHPHLTGAAALPPADRQSA